MGWARPLEPGPQPRAASPGPVTRPGPGLGPGPGQPWAQAQALPWPAHLSALLAIYACIFCANLFQTMLNDILNTLIYIKLR